MWISYCDELGDSFLNYSDSDFQFIAPFSVVISDIACIEVIMINIKVKPDI